MSFAILRIQKEHNRAGVASRAAHNLRQRSAAPRADAGRVGQNKTVGAETPDAVLAALDARLAALPKIQKNAVLVVELMLAASADWFAAGGKPGRFASEALEWAYAKFGKENVLTASLHRDEKTPHLQVLLTPIVEIKGVAKLRASHYFDGPAKMRDLQTEFAAHVEKLGLRRGIERKPGEPIKRHTTLKEYYKLVDQIVERATKARQAPAVPKLPARSGMLGLVSADDWKALADSLDKHGAEVARLQAEAIAGRLYMDSSVGTEVADRLARAQEAVKKAQEEARRAKEREASTQRGIEALEAAVAKTQAQIEGMGQKIAKLDAEIQRRAELLGIGRLEAHRDQLVEEIAELQRQRGEFDD